MKYKYIIWDWNGTLLNDAWLCVDVMNKMLENRNLPLVSESIYRQLFDFPVEEYYAKIGFDFQKESFELVGTEFITNYDKRHFECKLHEGTLDALNFFSENNIGQSILSARKQAQLQEEIEYFRLVSYFDIVSGLSHHYATSKLENGYLLIEKLGINPTEILFIGDTLHDYDVANELGTACALIENGHQATERLKKAGAKTYKNLCELVKEIFKTRVCL